MTVGGLAVLEAERSDLRSRICGYASERTGGGLDLRSPEPCVSCEGESLIRQEALAASRLAAVDILITSTQAAAQQTQTDQVRFGNTVELRHVGEHTGKGEYSFLMGGPDEPNSLLGYTTVSCISLIGKELMGAMVGDIVSLDRPSGGTSELEIVAIGLPELPAEQQRLHLQAVAA